MSLRDLTPAELSRLGATSYPPGQSHEKHAFRTSFPISVLSCWYCGLAEADPAHSAYRMDPLGFVKVRVDEAMPDGEALLVSPGDPLRKIPPSAIRISGMGAEEAPVPETFTVEFPEQGDEIEPAPELSGLTGIPLADMAVLEQVIAEHLGLPSLAVLPDDGTEVTARPTELVVNATTGEQVYRPLEDFDAFFAEQVRAQGESEDAELDSLRKARAVTKFTEHPASSVRGADMLDLLGIPRED